MNIGPISRSYFSQRLKLNYVEWGNPNKPTLLMIHGMRDHCRNWDWVAQHFGKDYRIIAPDLRGHGDSEWINSGSYNVTDFVADINQLVSQKTAVDEKITILSHSFGGTISLLFTGIHPEKVDKLIAIEGLGPPAAVLKLMAETPIEERLTAWMAALKDAAGRTPKKYQDFDDATERMHEKNSHLSKEQAHHLSLHGLRQNEDGSYSWKFDNYLYVLPPNIAQLTLYESLLTRISCPVLLMRGATSWAEPLDDNQRAELIPHALKHTVDEAGHWLHHDQLEKFIQVAQKFLHTGSIA